jgi:hypothetical protein
LAAEVETLRLVLQMKSRQGGHPVVWCLSLALIAFAAGCGSPPSSGTVPSAAPTPTVMRDAGVAAYGSMVNGDTGALNTEFYKKFLCETRERCVGELQDIRAIAVSLLRHLTNSPAPEAISQPAANLNAATQQFIGRVDSSILTMQQPGSDYVHASDTLDLHALNLVAAEVVCWPAKVIPHEAGESGAGYVCG